MALPETEAFGCNCSGTLRFVILGPQTFCTEQGVTGLSCLLQDQSGGSSDHTTVRVIDFVRTYSGS